MLLLLLIIFLVFIYLLHLFVVSSPYYCIAFNCMNVSIHLSVLLTHINVVFILALTNSTALNIVVALTILDQYVSTSIE